ncbi:MAG: SH3 domain-containing protein [Clostridiales bacterium]|nr:SH3 domain-containing protein [Clostridiales bacterium]
MNFKFKAVRTLAAAGLALTMCTGVAFASIGSATVTADSLRLRSEASTSSGTVTMAPKGAEVTVEEDAGNGWYKVTYGSQTGYMSGAWLTVTLEDGTVVPATEGTEPEQQRGLVTADVLNVRSGPATTYDKVTTLKAGTVVDIVADPGNGWYQIESGYVSAEYIVLVGADYEGSSELGAAAAAMAKSLLGCRYVSGGAGPNSFDCSGLMYYIYKQLGHPISRGSSSQYYNNGYFVSISAMQPGDLIFFFDRRFDSSGGTLPTTHVGMYVGNGQFIHASTTTYRVQYDSISGYYAPYIVGAKRIG